MSDNKTPEPEFGEPVAEPTSVENVVDRAHEALADAQVARDEVAAPVEADAPVEAQADASAPVEAAPAVPEAPAVPAAPAEEEPDWSALDEVMAAEAAVASESGTTGADAPVIAPAAISADAPASNSNAWYNSPEVAESTSNLPESVQTVTELPTPPAPFDEDPVLTGTAPAQPIFVQAPEPPVVRGNRGAAGAIGLLVAVVFAVLYLAARLLFSGINVLNVDQLLDETIAQVSGFGFWVPVVVFYLSFWLLGAFVNRGRWAYWVIFGLFVGIAAYAGHTIGAVIAANPWEITWDQALTIMKREALAPAAIAALVIGRELPIWFGGWIAKRGRKITAENAEAQDEYERTLEAGPQMGA